MQYRDRKICIVEDYCPEVLRQHIEYREVMAVLYKRGLKPALLYAARLRITLPSGDKKWLRSADEARVYMDNLPPA